MDEGTKDFYKILFTPNEIYHATTDLLLENINGHYGVRLDLIRPIEWEEVNKAFKVANSGRVPGLDVFPAGH